VVLSVTLTIRVPSSVVRTPAFFLRAIRRLQRKAVTEIAKTADMPIKTIRVLINAMMPNEKS
jgi:DNA-binding IclR family transcriptional regulator